MPLLSKQGLKPKAPRFDTTPGGTPWAMACCGRSFPPASPTAGSTAHQHPPQQQQPRTSLQTRNNSDKAQNDRPTRHTPATHTRVATQPHLRPAGLTSAFQRGTDACHREGEKGCCALPPGQSRAGLAGGVQGAAGSRMRPGAGRALETAAAGVVRQKLICKENLATV